MLNFRGANIALFVALAAMLLAHNAWWPLPWWSFGLLLAAYVTVLVWGAASIASGFYMPVVCAAQTDEKVVAFTFDDGPSPDHTPRILDILQREQAPAAFFCIGKNIMGREQLLQRIYEEGHLAGNHSFSHHFWFDMFGAGRMLAELRQTDNAVEQATGKRPRLFRPPYGVTNPNLRKAVEKGGYIPVGWNVRSLDTMIKEPEQLLERIRAAVKPGAVILLHDSMEVTVRALPALIAHLRENGYRIERIDKMLNIPAYV